MTQTDINGDPLIIQENVEWYTPKHLLDAVYATIGTPDLDPCCNTIGSPNVAARNYYCLADNGLAHNWNAENIFLNPPYGEELPEWIDKMIYHFRNRDVTNAILLIPAKTETTYWHKLADYAPAWCAVKGRISFISPTTGNTKQTGRFP